LSSLNGGETVFKIIRTSSLYETQPWLEKNTTWFVNAIIEIKTNLLPQNLLTECLKIEKLLGRNREVEGLYGDRTIDIDILFYDKEIISEDNLQIPHKFLHQRAFILVPMLELDSDLIHPVLQKSMADLHEELENPEMVYLYGTRIEGM
jgi:2-amino-4-hydroxy-6-hydroxymethyldihydropteridine diphosphokinase